MRLTMHKLDLHHRDLETFTHYIYSPLYISTVLNEADRLKVALYHNPCRNI